MLQTTIAQIRALVGTPPDTLFYTTDPGQEGMWKYDSSDQTGTDNTGTILETDDNYKIKRVYDGPVHTDWFGFAKDGTDERILLQTILTDYKSIVIDAGTITVRAIRNCLLMQDDQTIEFAPGAKIRGIYDTITPGDGTYQILRATKKRNIKIINPVIQGDRTDSPLTSSQYGMLISLTNVADVTITGGELWDAWGDGIYINGDNSWVNPNGGATVENPSDDLQGTRNVSIGGNGMRIHDCRRQGVSVIGGRFIDINSIIIHDISGSNPQAAIDLEPDNETKIVDSVTISNILAYNCQHGFVSNGSNVTFSNCQGQDLRGRGFWIANGQDLGIAGSGQGNRITNCTITNYATNYAAENEWGEGIYIVAQGVTLVNVQVKQGSGVQGIIVGTDNVTINSCEVDGAATTGISVTPGSDNVKIINTIVKNNVTGITHAGSNGLIDGCTLENNQNDALRINNPTNTDQITLVHGNLIINNQYHGIEVNGGTNKIIGNILRNNAQAGTGFRNIWIGSSNNEVTGNTVRQGTDGSGYYGIEVTSAGDSNKIIDNDYAGSGTVQPFKDNGTNTVLREL